LLSDARRGVRGGGRAAALACTGLARRHLSFSFAGPRHLRDVLRVELLDDEKASAADISDLWLRHHEQKAREKELSPRALSEPAARTPPPSVSLGTIPRAFSSNRRPLFAVLALTLVWFPSFSLVWQENVVGICLKGEEGTKILDRASQWYEKRERAQGRCSLSVC
jgi:hypothetical protein